MDARERAVGSVLGLALGDALGAPFEFRRAAQVPDPVPAFELGWMGLPPGTTTDDTAMARNLVRSLVERGALDTTDVLARHIAWLESRPPDVGNLTRIVLSRAAEGAPDAAREYVERRGPEVSAGNGSVMYCAPLGVAYAFRPHDLFELAPALSAVTHWDERCRTACLAVTLAVAGLVRGEPSDRAVIDAVTAVAEREGGEELEYLVEAAGRARPVDGPDQGFALFAAGSGLAGRGGATGVRGGTSVRGRARRRHGHERGGGGGAARGGARYVRTCRWDGSTDCRIATRSTGRPACSRTSPSAEADGSGRIGR